MHDPDTCEEECELGIDNIYNIHDDEECKPNATLNTSQTLFKKK